MSNIVKIHQEIKKLRDFTSNEWGAISVQFQGLSSFMGLKELSPENTKAMIDLVLDEFKDFSFDEIQKAFKMNISGKLLDSRGEKTKPYGSFNIDYVGTVLALYRTYGTNEIRKINKAAPMPEKSQEQKNAEIKSTMDEIFKELNIAFKNNEVKKRGFLFYDNYAIKYYGCLKYFNILPEYKGDQIDLPKELWEKAKQMRINHLKLEVVKIVESADLMDKSKRIKYNAMIACITNPKATVSDELRNKCISAVKSNYESLLVSKCLIDLSDMFDDLNDCIE